MQAIAATFAAMIGSGMVVRSMPYTEGFGAKQVAWVVHSGIMGAVIAPLCFLGGPLLLRAACYTGGIVGGKWIEKYCEVLYLLFLIAVVRLGNCKIL